MSCSYCRWVGDIFQLLQVCGWRPVLTAAVCDITAGWVCPLSARTPTSLSVVDSVQTVQTGFSVTSQCAANVRHTGPVNTLCLCTRNLAGHRTQQRIIIRSAEQDRSNKNTPEIEKEEEEERRKSSWVRHYERKCARLDEHNTLVQLFSNLTFGVDTWEM